MANEKNQGERPATKRVRSDQDHSKAETKQAEDDKKPNEDKEKKEGESHEDEDWMKKAPFKVGESWDGWETKWTQSCWCGKLVFVYSEDPLQSKICHCEDCQRLHGASFQHSAVFKKDAVRLESDARWLGFLSAHGEVHPLSSTPTPLPRKLSCRACGSPLSDEGRNMVMAFPPAFHFPRGDIDEPDSAAESKYGKSEEQGKEDKEANKDKDLSGQQKEVDAGDEKKGAAGGRGEGTGGKGKVGMPDVFKAGCHIFYAQRAMDVPDGLPKWSRHKDQSELIPERD